MKPGPPQVDIAANIHLPARRSGESWSTTGGHTRQFGLTYLTSFPRPVSSMSRTRCGVYPAWNAGGIPAGSVRPSANPALSSGAPVPLFQAGDGGLLQCSLLGEPRCSSRGESLSLVYPGFPSGDRREGAISSPSSIITQSVKHPKSTSQNLSRTLCGSGMQLL